ncbi:MAG TPA: efflux RND transporter periplasmic adaptor subunit [Alphaproteobacteria bacterium]
MSDIKKPRRRWRRLALAALLLAAAGGTAWYAMGGVAIVTASRPERGPAVEAVYATGAVEPTFWAKVSSTQVGRIAEIPIKEGDRVKTGDVLMRLDDREAKHKLAEAEAKERFLAQEVTRMSVLAQRDFASQQTFQRTVSDHGQAMAAVAAARQRLADLTLTAPLDGEVLRLDGNVGEVLRSGDVAVWIGQREPMRIEAEVDEEDIPKVQRGQKVLVKADAWPSKLFAAQVTSLTPKGDPVSKNYRVRITLDPGQPLQIGMTTEVNIVVRETKDALLVPFSALRGEAVFLVEGARVRRRTIRVGIVGTTKAEVLDGLKETDLVVSDPPAGLKDGDFVKVRAAQPAPGAAAADKKEPRHQ